MVLVLNEHHCAYAEGKKLTGVGGEQDRRKGEVREMRRKKRKIEADILLSEKKTNERVRNPRSKREEDGVYIWRVSSRMKNRQHLR